MFICLLGHYEQFVSKIQKNTQAEGITGHMFMYPDCVVHLIEVKSESIIKVVSTMT